MNRRQSIAYVKKSVSLFSYQISSTELMGGVSQCPILQSDTSEFIATEARSKKHLPKNGLQLVDHGKSFDIKTYSW